MMNIEKYKNFQTTFSKMESDFEEEIKTIKDSEKEWRESKFDTDIKIAEFKSEMKSEAKEMIKGLRLDYLKNRLGKIEKKLLKIEKEYLEDRGKNVPYFWRKAIYDLKGGENLPVERNKIQGEIYYLENEQFFKDQKIGLNEIRKAKDYPFERLLKLKNNFAKCPFHSEKRESFYVKNNWFYCFGCGESGDTIAFVRKTMGTNFVEAVKFLQN